MKLSEMIEQMKIADMLEVMQAYSRGEKIEFKVGSLDWTEVKLPAWNWEVYIYRIAPKYDRYAELKAAVQDPTKEIWFTHSLTTKSYFIITNPSFSYPIEQYQIRDKAKKVAWSECTTHVTEYWTEHMPFPSCWIPWGLPEFGNTCPLPKGVLVEVLLRNGTILQGEATKCDWRIYKHCDSYLEDIIAFHIIGTIPGYA